MTVIFLDAVARIFDPLLAIDHELVAIIAGRLTLNICVPEPVSIANKSICSKQPVIEIAAEFDASGFVSVKPEVDPAVFDPRRKEMFGFKKMSLIPGVLDGKPRIQDAKTLADRWSAS